MNVYTFSEEGPVIEGAPITYLVVAFDKDTHNVLAKYEGSSKEEALQYEINFINNGCKKVLTHNQCNELIAEWNQADQQQKFWREKELSLRASLVAEKYTQDKGTQRIDLEAGWQLVIERGEDYKLENGNNETQDVVDDLPEELASLLVKWKPEIQKKNFEQASQETKDKFAAILTIKPSSPQVKLVPPKAPKG